ncbi:MAG: DUF2069 domain-containing protein [Rubrivivax sp.]|nr:DUF2069 domain-containing protein [Rubrivivax sp.]
MTSLAPPSASPRAASNTVPGALSSGSCGAAAPAAPLARTAAASPAVRTLRAATLASTLALLALGLAWELWLAPTGRGTLALKVLPLLPALPGLLRHRLYTFRWLSLLVWLYALEGLVRAASEPGTGAWLAALEVALAVAVFAAATLYIRRRLAAGKAMAAGAGSTPTDEGAR